MESNSVRRRNNSAGDDVVAIHQRTSNRLTDAVDVDRGSGDEGDDKTNCCSEQCWNHQGAKPTHVNAVVGRSYPFAERIPGVIA